MTSIDPRLADRRREVAEDRARKNIKRLLRLIIVLGIAGAVVWLFLSPALSVNSVDVTGVSSSRAHEILGEEQVVTGRPLILIRAGSVEGRLLSDPWISSADVDVNWPNGVDVVISERTPVAWVETGDGWAGRAVDGVALPGFDTPDDSMAHIVLPTVADSEIYDSFEVIGSLEFVAALPTSLGAGAVVELRQDELWATVAGFDIRLGRPVEMEAKALTLAALLQNDLAAGSKINLIAPTNPAILPPDRGAAPDDQNETGDDDGSGDNSNGTLNL